MKMNYITKNVFDELKDQHSLKTIMKLRKNTLRMSFD